MIATDTVLESRYRIEGLIDRGGMADVYRALDQRLEREVAVKVLRDVEHQRRFAAEARTLARLQHPNLVRLLDAGTDNGDAFLVLELLGGATVRELVARGPLDQSRVAGIGAETAAALAYIHRRGIVHRDVKPSNLMLDEHGAVRLADFGIARLLGGTTITATNQTIGTMAYIAPEQLEGSDVGPATDVYSLGLVLIECLTGRRVFDGSPAEAAARLSRDPDIPTGLPAPWPPLLRAMTAADPDLRPGAAETHDQLSTPYAASGPAATVPLAAALAEGDMDTVDGAGATVPAAAMRTEVAPSNVPPLRQRRHRRPWASVLLIAALVAGLSVLGLVLYAATSGGASSPKPAATTTTVAPTTLPPTTLPPTTLPPATSPKGKGKDKGGGKHAADELRKQLEEIRRRFEEQASPGD